MLSQFRHPQVIHSYLLSRPRTYGHFDLLGTFWAAVSMEAAGMAAQGGQGEANAPPKIMKRGQEEANAPPKTMPIVSLADHTRGFGSNFALVGQKGVRPGEEEVGGSFSPHPLDLNVTNLFSNSADIQRWQNTEQACRTAIKSGRGEGLAEGCEGRGSRCLPRGNF